MYYKNVMNGEIVGITESDTFIFNDNFELIDEKEFNELAEQFGYIRERKPISNEKLMESQIKSLSDRNEFLEDCIAEMAMLIYSE